MVHGRQKNFHSPPIPPRLPCRSHKLWWMDSTSQAQIIKLLEAAHVDVNL